MLLISTSVIRTSVAQLPARCWPDDDWPPAAAHALHHHAHMQLLHGLQRLLPGGVPHRGGGACLAACNRRVQLQTHHVTCCHQQLPQASLFQPWRQVAHIQLDGI
jgi:hypothetical protein